MVSLKVALVEMIVVKTLDFATGATPSFGRVCHERGPLNGSQRHSALMLDR